ncbi:MAG: glycosyltransferase [Nitrososphaera sp.]
MPAVNRTHVATPLDHYGMQDKSTKLPFIVFSDDWGEHPSSCQHLFRQIAKEHEVLWVNTIGMRQPTLTWTDLGKAAQKVRKMLKYTNNSCARIEDRTPTVCQPIMFPYITLEVVRRFNQYSVTNTVRRAMRKAKLGRPYIVTTVPNACDYIGYLGERKVVYYCVDDFAEWPGLDKELVREMEHSLIAKADILLATSSKLFDRLSEYGKPTYLLTHGVDVDLFSVEVSEEHRCLSGIQRPRVGYLGLFDQRSDQGLIAALASRMKDCSFVVTGPVVVDVSAISRFKNVHFTGAVPYEELPAVIRGLDVLCIPYVVNKLTTAISPLKFKEYLATGKQIVSTPIPEVKPDNTHVFAPTSVDEWDTVLRTCLSNRPANRRGWLHQDLAEESWEKKAQLFLDICCE